MKVFFWQGGQDGTAYYRTVLPSHALRWHGHETSASMQMSPEAYEQTEVFVGQRVAAEGATQTWQRLAAEGRKLVIDFDDDFFHINPDNRAAYEFWTQPHVLERLRSNIAVSTALTVVSEGLAEVMRELHDNVIVIPNGLPAQMLGRPRDYFPDRPVRIGWAGTASTMHELPIVSRALNRITSLRAAGGTPEVRLVGITAQDAVQRARLTARGIGACGWVANIPQYHAQCAEFDVWVAPYRDNAFNRAKFPTKALEAGMLGIPLIASDIRPYRDWVEEHGDDCGVILVESEQDWGKHLKALVEDADYRQAMGLAASSAAATHTLQSLGGRWADELDTVLNRVH